MNRFVLPMLLVSTLPFAASAQELPLYIDHGGELSFTGEMLNDADLNDMFGGRGIVDIFGVPEIIVKDAQTGALSPVYVPPEYYEIVSNADGVIENQRDDLTFKEGEGSDLRDDLEFAEDEGSDTREDLVFSKEEGLTTDVVFEGPKDFFSGEGPKYIDPQHGTWRIQITKTEITGCPAGVGEMAGAQALRSGRRDVIFSHPGWVPADLNPDYAKMTWHAGGFNGFYAEPYRLDAEGSGMALSVSFALVARSDTKIDVWSRVLIRLTPFLAQMAGSAEVCSAIVAGSYVKS